MPSFRLIKNGMAIAETAGPGAEAFIMSAAIRHRRRGDVKIEVRQKARPGRHTRRWKRFAHFEKWPDPNAEE